MANGELRKGWRTAVIFSVVLHALAISGFQLVPARSTEDLRGRPCGIDGCCVDNEEAGGAAHFLPSSRTETNERKFGSLETWPHKPTPEDPSEPMAKTKNWGALIGSSFPGGSQKAQSVLGNGPGKGGRGATTTFFQVAAQGLRIVYVIDASMSMGKDNALRLAAQELVASIEKLPASARFQVIVYNTQARFLIPRREQLLSPTVETIDAVTTALGTLDAEGGTDHAPALRKALALRADVLYFLTDADDLKQEHVRLARKLNTAGTVIHTIELTLKNRHRLGMPLQLLASDSHGQYHAVALTGPGGKNSP